MSKIGSFGPQKYLKFSSCIATTVALVAGAAHAATDVSDARVVQLRVDNNDNASITFDKDGAGRPSCASFDNGRTLTVNVATNGGREMLKAGTAAYLAGKRVRFVGTGTCTLHPAKENLLSLYVFD